MSEREPTVRWETGAENPQRVIPGDVAYLLVPASSPIFPPSGTLTPRTDPRRCLSEGKTLRRTEKSRYIRVGRASAETASFSKWHQQCDR